MLKAFQTHINSLAVDPDKIFEKRVQERLGKKKLSAGFVAELKEFVMFLPKIESSKQFRLRKQGLELRNKVVRIKNKVVRVIPKEAVKINLMIDELFDGDEKSYQKLFEGKIPT